MTPWRTPHDVAEARRCTHLESGVQRTFTLYRESRLCLDCAAKFESWIRDFYPDMVDVFLDEQRAL